VLDLDAVVGAKLVRQPLAVAMGGVALIAEQAERPVRSPERGLAYEVLASAISSILTDTIDDVAIRRRTPTSSPEIDDVVNVLEDGENNTR
jgi:hypothetical protein